MLNNLNHSPIIELAILFNLENQSSIHSLTALRNIVRIGLLNHCKNKTKDKNIIVMRTILNALPACNSVNALLTLLRKQSSSMHRFFSSNPLRTIINKEIVPYIINHGSSIRYY
jgi:hypothetical protein